MCHVAAAPEQLPNPEANLIHAFNEMHNELSSTLFLLLGNHADAQDVLQNAFLNCWQARHRVAGVSNVRAWVWRVAINAGKDLRRTVWRRRSRPLTAALAGGAVHPRECPVSAFESRERVQRLRAALGELRPEEKEVFLLRENGDLTYEEIAEVLGANVNTLKTRMRAAVIKLRRVLREDGAEPPADAAEGNAPAAAVSAA
jgi:RNA polymerase sigma-70 factor (ECF subfamily)